MFIMDCPLLESFEDNQEGDTEDYSVFDPDQTYFSISHTNPSDKTNSSSSRLKKLLNKQNDNATDNKNDEEAPKLQYWFWDGESYSSKTLQEVIRIIFGWKKKCPDKCNLWIQIGDTQPIQVDKTNRKDLKQALQQGLKDKADGLDGCCTPQDSPPDDDFRCIPCRQKSKQQFKPQLSGNSEESSNLNAHSPPNGEKIDNNVSNYRVWDSDKLRNSNVQELLQEVFNIKNECNDNCKLWLSLTNRRPVEVQSANESKIRSMLTNARKQGNGTNITLCCAPKNVKLNQMYNAEDNTFNCQRCTSNIMDEGSAADESTTVNANEQQMPYSGVNIAPRMMQPSGPRWTSADNNVTPYNMGVNEGAQLMNAEPALIVNNTATLQTNNQAHRESIYTNARPVINTIPTNNANNQLCQKQHISDQSFGYDTNNTYSDNNNVIFHKHIHTFTNSANMCN